MTGRAALGGCAGDGLSRCESSELVGQFLARMDDEGEAVIVMATAMGGVVSKIVQRDFRRTIGHKGLPGARQRPQRLRAAGGQGYKKESPSRARSAAE